MCRRTRFTLVEFLAIAVVIALLVAIMIPMLVKAKERTAQVGCINNVRNISMAIQLFYNQNLTYPQDGFLRDELKPFLSKTDDDVFSCPTSHAPYELFCVPRTPGEEDTYFVGCPHHKVVNFAPGKGTNTFRFGKILHNGNEVPAGSEVENGTLTFEDGSAATITGKVMALMSFRAADGGLYTILRVFEDYGNSTINVVVPNNITPKSRFEVVTPAAIAGVAGTKFEVRASVLNGGQDVETEVTVTDGAVTVNGPGVKKDKLTKGQTWKHQDQSQPCNNRADGNNGVGKGKGKGNNP